MPADRKTKSSVPEPILQMLSGGLAGCMIWLPPVYSLDVIKTRMQTAKPGKYSGVVDCAVKTWRCDQSLTFYRVLQLGSMFTQISGRRLRFKIHCVHLSYEYGEGQKDKRVASCNNEFFCLPAFPSPSCFVISSRLRLTRPRSNDIEVY